MQSRLFISITDKVDDEIRLGDISELDMFCLDLRERNSSFKNSYDPDDLYQVMSDEPSPSGKMYLGPRTSKQRYVYNLSTGKVSCRSIHTKVIMMACQLQMKKKVIG